MSAPDGHRPASDWERRRRLAEVFGEVLPDVTGDERDVEAAGRATGDDAADSATDRWLRSQVPPHHG